MPSNHNSGFTLVEIMIVVVIVGLLAAMAIPAFSQARENSQNARLANDIRTFVGMINTYILEEGDYPEDSGSGAIPEGFSPYIQEEQWYKGPSIGGVWDVEKNSYGVLSAVGVHRFTASTEQLEKFDRKFDDGDLSTGQYRKLDGDRYYFVIAE